MSNIEKNLLESIKNINKEENKKYYSSSKITCFEDGNINFFSHKYSCIINNLLKDEKFKDVENSSQTNFFKVNNKYFYIYFSENINLYFLFSIKNGISKMLYNHNFTLDRSYIFSKCGNFFIFFSYDSSSLNIFDINSCKVVKNIYLKLNSARKIFLKISDDNLLVLLVQYDNINIWNLQTNTKKSFILQEKIIDCFIYDDKTIKIACQDEKIFQYKDAKINIWKEFYHPYIEKNKYYYSDGLFLGENHLCLSSARNGTIGTIKFINLNCLKNDFFKIKDEFYDYCVTPDLNYFIKLNYKGIEIIDISSLIQNKKYYILLEFLNAIKLNDENSINIFSKNYLYDKNMLNLIFQFIPL